MTTATATTTRRLIGVVRPVDWASIAGILLLLLARSSCNAAATAAAAALRSTGKSRPVLESTSASGLSEPTSYSSSSSPVGLVSSLREIKSFENPAPLMEDFSGGDSGQRSKVRKSDDRWDNGTETENRTTSSTQLDSWSTQQQSHLPRRSVSSSRRSEDDFFKVKDVAMSKVTPESVFKTTTTTTTTTTTADLSGLNCCSLVSNDRSTSPPDVGSYDEYDEDDDDDAFNDGGGGGGGGGEEVDETEKDETETDGSFESDAYGYGDRSDGARVDGEDKKPGGGGGGGEGDYSAGEGGGVDSAKVEYAYVTDDNVTDNESEIASNQGKHEWKNPDGNYYYSQGAVDAEWRASGLMVNGQVLRGGLIDHDPGSRDYVLGVRHRGFNLHVGQQNSGEMRRSSYQRRSSLNLRWLEHRPVNPFAVFLWLAAALAFVGVAITAYRFRHSVIGAIQSTRANYKHGRRIGVEESNGLLSHAQV